jgi:hypothetical protein
MHGALITRNEVTFVTHTSATGGVFDPQARNKVVDSPTLRRRLESQTSVGWMLE